MSGVFHKSVYTSRSAGYKYRTFSVNTDEEICQYVTKSCSGCFIEVFEQDEEGLQTQEDKYRTFSINTDEEKWRETYKKVSYIDKKYKEIGELIVSKIDKETEKQEASRNCLGEKLKKIESIIDSLLDFQNNVIIMRDGLTTARATLKQLSERVNKVDELLIIKSSVMSQRRSDERGDDTVVTTFFSKQRPLQKNDSSSITTHI